MRRIYMYLVVGLFASLLWGGFTGSTAHAAPQQVSATSSQSPISTAIGPVSLFAIDIGDIECDSGTTAVDFSLGDGLDIHGSAIIVDYVMCPIVTGMYSAIGLIIDMTERTGLLEVTPLLSGGVPSSDSAKSLNAAWTVFRDLANFGLVIGLFVVIFSQATSYGLSAYGVRKMLPKIVIAALLINLSYVICAVLVDVFNILGSSIDDLLKAGIGPDTGISETLKRAVDTGPAGALASTVGALVMALLMGLVLFILLCFGLLCIFFLIARQILIVVLIVAAPLAFISWLFPNTQSYFKKWWSTLIRLLAIYPIVMSLKAITLVIMLGLGALIR